MSTLLEHLAACEILSAEQLRALAALPEAKDPDPRVLAKVILQRGWLSRFQINLAAAGKGRELLVGPYLLLDRLGEGGMGQVFKARHRHMNRLVALKLMRKEKLSSEYSIRRFSQEVQAAASLVHPNIALAFDAGQAGATYFFSMEYVDGPDLLRLVKEHGVLSVEQACDFVRQAALGLQHAHERGLVHRDIKPGNLMVASAEGGQPVVKILDLGLARLGDSFQKDRNLTRSGQVLGTPDYLAPEQARDARNVDIRADVYSLGCTLYFLLAGRPPFRAGSLAELLMKHQSEATPSIRTMRPDVPEDLDAFMQRMMAKKPDDRPATPAEVAEALTPFARGEANGNGDPAVISSLPAPVRGDTWAGLSPDAEGVIARSPMRVLRDHSRSIAELPDKKAREARTLRILIGATIATGVLFLGLAILAIILVSRPAKPEKDKPIATGVDKDRDRDKDKNDQEHPEKDKDGKAEEKDKPPKDGGKKPVPLVIAPDPGIEATVTRKDGHVLFKGHTKQIIGLAVSPDGRWAATGGEDNRVLLWDLENERALRRFDPAAPVISVGFSADGRKLFASAGGSILEWDLESRKKVDHPGMAGAGLVPTGRRAFAFMLRNEKPITRIMDVAAGKEKTPVPGVEFARPWYAFDKEGKTAFVLWPSSLVQRIDLETATDAGRLRIAGNRKPRALALGAKKDEFYVGCEDGSIHQLRWAAVRSRVLSAKHGSAVESMDVSPDGRKILSTCQDSDVRLVELTRPSGAGLFRLHTSPPRIVRFCQGGRKAVSVGGDMLILWDLDKPTIWIPPPPPPPGPEKGVEGAVLRLDVPAGRYARALFFSADGKKALSASGREVLVHDLEKRKVVQAMKPEKGSILALAATKDWKRVLSVGSDHALRMWDVDAGKEVGVLTKELGVGAMTVAVSPDGKYALVGDGYEAALWDLKEKKEVHRFTKTKITPQSAAFTADGKYMAVATFNLPLRIWEVESRKPITVKGADRPGSLTLAPATGSNLLVGTREGEVQLWDCANGERIKGFTSRHASKVTSLVMSPEGKKVLSAANGFTPGEGRGVPTDPTVRIHDVETGVEVGRINLTDRPFSLAVSADGRYALIGEGRAIRYIDLVKVLTKKP
jgi:serine/threonine-protein kinase